MCVCVCIFPRCVSSVIFICKLTCFSHSGSRYIMSEISHRTSPFFHIYFYLVCVCVCPSVRPAYVVEYLSDCTVFRVTVEKCISHIVLNTLKCSTLCINVHFIDKLAWIVFMFVLFVSVVRFALLIIANLFVCAYALSYFWSLAAYRSTASHSFLHPLGCLVFKYTA
jgi:hypothetical protein